MIRQTLLCIGVAALTACASGGGWTQSSWLGQQASDFNSGPYKLSASPVGGGFKLKLTVSTDAFFNVSRSAGEEGVPPPTEEDLIEAAKAAAPEGCTFKSLELTEDGALADYDCEEAAV